MGHMNLSKTNDCPAWLTLEIPNANPKGSLGLKFRDELVQQRVEWKGEIQLTQAVSLSFQAGVQSRQGLPRAQPDTSPGTARPA